MKIAIIGCGSMGMAFARSFLQYDLVKKEDLLLIGKENTALKSKQIGHADLPILQMNQRIATCDLIILAVKPQDFPVAAAELKPFLQPKQILLSIMAGVTIDAIANSLQHRLIVRCMPNTPAILSMGITGFTASKDLSFSDLRKIENLINATGRSVYLEEESLLDAVTALSGSGPAYFYYIVKQMIDAGKQMGLEESVAALLVKQTMQGSFHLLNTANKSLDDLIAAVASKGGTTEAALHIFETQGLSESLKNGIWAAEKRAKELSK